MEVRKGMLMALEGPNDFKVAAVTIASDTFFWAGNCQFSQEGDCLDADGPFCYARPAMPEDEVRYTHDLLLDEAFAALKVAQPLRWSNDKLRKVVEALNA